MSEKNIVRDTAKALGMTQKKLAEEIGVSETTTSSWNNGNSEVPKWALKLFELMKNEQKNKEHNAKLEEIITLAQELKLN